MKSCYLTQLICSFHGQGITQDITCFQTRDVTKRKALTIGFPLCSKHDQTPLISNHPCANATTLIKAITACCDTGECPVALYTFPMFRFNIPSESVRDCVRLWICTVDSTDNRRVHLLFYSSLTC